MFKKIFIILCFVICLCCFSLLVLDILDKKEGEAFYKNVLPSNNIINIDEMNSEYEETIGYIEILDTNIAFPIVQGENNSYYLKHLPNGNKNKMGSIFLDYRNDMYNDKNTIIYGHNFNDGTMFSDLLKFKNKDFYNTHLNYVIYTKQGIMNVSIIGGYLADATKSELLIDFNFLDELTFNFEKIFENDIEINEDDKFITLCTCDEKSNLRFILIGKVDKRN